MRRDRAGAPGTVGQDLVDGIGLGQKLGAPGPDAVEIGLDPFEQPLLALDSVPKGTESLNLRALGKGYEFGISKLA